MNSVRLEFCTRCGESIFHFAMAAGLVYATVNRLLPRQRLKLYLICYAIFRFVTEYIRPAGVWWLGLTWYQWVVFATAVGLAMQWYFETRPQGNGDRAIV